MEWGSLTAQNGQKQGEINEKEEQGRFVLL